MSELQPTDRVASAELLARQVMSTVSGLEPVVIPDDIVLAGKPAAVSLIAEGYAALAAIRARDRETDLNRLVSGDGEFALSYISADPRGIDRARGAQLGQLIARSPLFKGAIFAGSYLAHSTSRGGTAQDVLLEDINKSLQKGNSRVLQRRYAELCLAGMHAFTTRAAIYSSGPRYLEEVDALHANLLLNGASDEPITTGLRNARPASEQLLERYFESVVGLSRTAIGLIDDRNALIKQHESLPARLRRRLLRSVN